MRKEAVVLPDLGTSPDQPILISHWFVRRGQEVWQGERLVEVIVGPSTFDVPSPCDGRLAEIRGRVDDRVVPGTILGYMAVPEPEDGDASS